MCIRDRALGVRPASIHPRATEHIDDIIELISSLIQKGHAYVAENGDVYYDVKLSLIHIFHALAIHGNVCFIKAAQYLLQ